MSFKHIGERILVRILRAINKSLQWFIHQLIAMEDR
jgi:hypothetical protein